MNFAINILVVGHNKTFLLLSEKYTHMKIEKISAVTLKVSDMERSVQFYRDIVGLEARYTNPNFSSFNAGESILNLERGNPARNWGRIIFYVDDVDEFWEYFKEKGLDPERPRDAEWGERYFHLNDPDGHELSFAKSIKPR